MKQNHFRAVCQSCGGSYWTCRSHSKTCGPVCKKRLQRGVDCQGLGRRLGERQKKSPAQAASVPVSPAGEKGTDWRDQLEHEWPQDMEIIFDDPTGRKKPGRVDWLSCTAKTAREQRGKVLVNLGFTWKWVHPANLINPTRRRK